MGEALDGLGRTRRGVPGLQPRQGRAARRSMPSARRAARARSASCGGSRPGSAPPIPRRGATRRRRRRRAAGVGPRLPGRLSALGHHAAGAGAGGPPASWSRWKSRRRWPRPTTNSWPRRRASRGCAALTAARPSIGAASTGAWSPSAGAIAARQGVPRQGAGRDALPAAGRQAVPRGEGAVRGAGSARRGAELLSQQLPDERADLRLHRPGRDRALLRRRRWTWRRSIARVLPISAAGGALRAADRRLRRRAGRIAGFLGLELHARHARRRRHRQPARGAHAERAAGSRRTEPPGPRPLARLCGRACAGRCRSWRRGSNGSATAARDRRPAPAPAPPSAGPARARSGASWSTPSAKIGRRTCSELGVATARGFSKKRRQAGIERQVQMRPAAGAPRPRCRRPGPRRSPGWTWPGSTASKWAISVHVVGVVAAEVGQIVGEVEAAGEVLAEGRDAAAERMAAHVDDPRVRQHQPDQADVQEVPRRLVDEARPAEAALGAGAGQVVVAELAKAARGRSASGAG